MGEASSGEEEIQAEVVSSFSGEVESTLTGTYSIITSDKEVMFSLVFLVLFVGSITQKLPHRFPPNSV